MGRPERSDVLEHSVSGPNGCLQGPHGLPGHVQGQLVPWSRDVGSQAHPSPGREACLEGGWTQLAHHSSPGFPSSLPGPLRLTECAPTPSFSLLTSLVVVFNC